MDVALWDNKDGRDQYENDGMVTQDVPYKMKQEQPDLRGPIIGNFKYPDGPVTAMKDPAADVDDTDIPF